MCCSDWVRHRVGPGSDGIRAWESGSILRRLRDTLELASGFVGEEDDSISAMDRKESQLQKLRAATKSVIGKEENSEYIKIKSLKHQNRDEMPTKSIAQKLN